MIGVDLTYFHSFSSLNSVAHHVVDSFADIFPFVDDLVNGSYNRHVDSVILRLARGRLWS